MPFEGRVTPATAPSPGIHALSSLNLPRGHLAAGNATNRQSLSSGYFSAYSIDWQNVDQDYQEHTACDDNSLNYVIKLGPVNFFRFLPSEATATAAGKCTSGSSRANPQCEERRCTTSSSGNAWSLRQLRTAIPSCIPQAPRKDHWPATILMDSTPI
ncbi:hypothetical protein BV25DRAFT_1914811 [Artomyces pyxidatus]|uniref:Uncharacterized protein n=1 Tax=Artomyces pyxidatus TaxID=48021 RepID=A0ACB8T6W6_9AGAM|nr:hypothetical protein BV25DRAFT_1914811 [Artomyces pyxidatus]